MCCLKYDILMNIYISYIFCLLILAKKITKVMKWWPGFGLGVWGARGGLEEEGEGRRSGGKQRV